MQKKCLTMVTKNQLKYYSSLLNKKHRQEEKKFLVEGSKLLSEALDSGYECEIILALKDFIDENTVFSKLISNQKLNMELIKSIDFEKLCDTKNPKGVVGIFHFKQHIQNAFSNEKLIVAMENISDPGNMGTILRNCDWFGVKNILLSSNCAEIYNPKVIRASAGSVFHLNIYRKDNLINAFEEQKKLGYKIVCADLNGDNLYSFAQHGKLILVLANEANGPTEDMLKTADIKITIPRIGKAESLNVASASAVLLSELIKY